MMQKVENFRNALSNLREVRNYSAPYDVVTQTGLANLYSICFEQSWKMMKAVLEKQGISEASAGSPRMILKHAFKVRMICDEAQWLEMLDKRNELSHTYSSETSVEVIELVRESF